MRPGRFFRAVARALAGVVLVATAGVAALPASGAGAPPAPPAGDAGAVRPSVVTLRLRMGVMANVALYAPTMSRPDLLPVIFFSGDWGWRPLQQQSASFLAKQGRFVTGIDATEYFKKRLESAEWSADLKRLREFTNEKAGRPIGGPVLLIGFCWGGEVIPYALNRGGTSGFAGALLLGPDEESAFVYRISLQMPNVPSPPDEVFAVADELKRLPPAFPVVFIEGELDTNSAAKSLESKVPGPHKRAVVPGGDRQFKEVREIYFGLLSQGLEWIEQQAGGTAAPPAPAAPGTNPRAH